MLGVRQRGSRSPRYKNRLLRPEVALRAFEIDGIVVVDTMSEIRELRQRMGLSQQQCAALLDVAVETFLPWDSGRRRAPTAALQRARATVADTLANTSPSRWTNSPPSLALTPLCVKTLVQAAWVSVWRARKSVMTRW